MNFWGLSPAINTWHKIQIQCELKSRAAELDIEKSYVRRFMEKCSGAICDTNEMSWILKCVRSADIFIISIISLHSVRLYCQFRNMFERNDGGSDLARSTCRVHIAISFIPKCKTTVTESVLHASLVYGYLRIFWYKNEEEEEENK